MNASPRIDTNLNYSNNIFPLDSIRDPHNFLGDDIQFGSSNNHNNRLGDFPGENPFMSANGHIPGASALSQ